MPMVGTALASALKPVIEAQIRANYTIVAGFGDQEITKFAKAMSDAIGVEVVNYIKANALIVGTVTSGAGAGGAVTGTVT